MLPEMSKPKKVYKSKRKPVASSSDKAGIPNPSSQNVFDDIKEIAAQNQSGNDQGFDVITDVPVSDKDYGQKANIINADAFGVVPEHKLNKKTIDMNAVRNKRGSNDVFDDDKDESEDPKQQQKPSGSAPKQTSGSTIRKKVVVSKEPVIQNPYHDNLPSKREKEKSSMRLAEIMIMGMKAIDKLAAKMLSYGDGDIKKMCIKQGVDYEMFLMPIPITEDGSRTITVLEFIEDYNNQLAVILTTEEKDYESIKEQFYETFKEKGWGVTPTQSLIVSLLEMYFMKISFIIGLKRDLSANLKHFHKIYKENTAEVRDMIAASEGRINYQRQQQEQQPEPARQPEKPKEPEIENAVILDSGEEAMNFNRASQTNYPMPPEINPLQADAGTMAAMQRPKVGQMNNTQEETNTVHKDAIPNDSKPIANVMIDHSKFDDVANNVDDE